MKPSQIEKYCSGCDNNFYNGNNPYGVTQCWSVPTATLVFGKLVSIDQPDPEAYLRRAKSVRRPHCYRPKRVLFVKNKEREKLPGTFGIPAGISSVPDPDLT